MGAVTGGKAAPRACCNMLAREGWGGVSAGAAPIILENYPRKVAGGALLSGRLEPWASRGRHPGWEIPQGWLMFAGLGISLAGHVLKPVG